MAYLNEGAEETLRDKLWSYAVAYYEAHRLMVSNKDMGDTLRKEVEKANDIIKFVKAL